MELPFPIVPDCPQVCSSTGKLTGYGNRLVFQYCYKPGHVSSDCNLPLKKIQDLVTNYEKRTSDEKTRVLDTKYDFEKQLVPRRPEYYLANEVKIAQKK